MEPKDVKPKDDVAALLRKLIDETEQNIAQKCGMKLYKKEEGFTQSDIYHICGKSDSVVTVSFRTDSESEELYGSDITICVVYTRAQRVLLEKDSESLNDTPYVKAKYLLFDLDDDKVLLLSTKGFKVADVTSLLVLENQQKENFYTSKDNRILNQLKIPFEPNGDSSDIYWMYGFLCKLRKDGVALTKDELSEYLAYKLILESDELSEDEKMQVFDDQGRICNNDVSWVYLKWKEVTQRLTDKDKEALAKLSKGRMYERIVKLDNYLKGIGGLKNLAKKCPEKCKLIVDKVLHFKDIRYNITGKHLLFLDLDGFLHIYLRHVRELTIEGLYSERTKFQLEENDVLPVMNQVLTSINEEYQLFREQYPDRSFRKYSDHAIYYNGDYYRIVVGVNGRVVTFFKENERPKC